MVNKFISKASAKLKGKWQSLLCMYDIERIIADVLGKITYKHCALLITSWEKMKQL